MPVFLQLLLLQVLVVPMLLAAWFLRQSDLASGRLHRSTKSAKVRSDGPQPSAKNSSSSNSYLCARASWSSLEENVKLKMAFRDSVCGFRAENYATGHGSLRQLSTDLDASSTRESCCLGAFTDTSRVEIRTAFVAHGDKMPE